MKTGVRLHAQVATFLSHIIRIYLCLGQVARSFERRSRGGGVAGATPPFWGSASLAPRFKLHSGGTWTPPRWGVAPATVIPAGRLEVWSCKGL